jgi:glycosyltransferase involved in cell wall biosynthesis
MDSKVRVLLVVTQSEFGGAQKYVYSLATTLPQFGFHVRTVCGSNGGLVSHLRAAEAEVIPLPALVRELNPISDWQAFHELRRIIRAWQPHIVHTNSSKAGLLGRLAARTCRTPVIIFTAHGFVLSEPLAAPTKLFYWCAEKVGALAGHYTIAVSEQDRQLAVRSWLTRPGRIVTIYNGLDPLPTDGLESAGSLRRELGLLAGSPLIGTVANFYPTKGLPDFIRSCALVRQQHPTARFVIVGDGADRPVLEALIEELGLRDSLHLAGRRPDAERIVADFDVFVMSSVKEGMPFALLEAMRQARPIVATRVGGIPEVLQGGAVGVLVEPGRHEQLAAAILQLLRQPDRAQALGMAARQRVATDFTSERMLAATVALYRRALTEAGLDLAP